MATLLFCCLALPTGLFSQAANGEGISQTTKPPPVYVTIDNIQVQGNDRTLPETILRELDFTIGDTISLTTLATRLEKNQNYLMNTGLFTSARLNFKDWEGTSNRVGLLIEVKESWYVFPFPIIELADRNFNVWWEEFNHSLRRLNLGVRFYHTNFTGRNDVLKTTVQFGFTKKYELKYSLPAFNRSQTLGLNTNILYTQEKEIGYIAEGNVLQFHRNKDQVLLQRFRAGLGLRYRPQLDATHQLDVQYHHNSINEIVRTELNPDFFIHDNAQDYFSASYQFSLDKRDIDPYPMSGYYVSTALSGQGFGLSDDIEALDLELHLRKYFSFGKKWSLELIGKGSTGLQRSKRPYHRYRALGYESDYLRGYEFYVIDGLDYAYHKQALRFQLFDRTVDWGDYMRLESFKKMPLKFFLVLHGEVGYVNDPFYAAGNPLSNEWLRSLSLGFDTVLYYDKVFSIEYSRNHLGEGGIFLHWAFSF